LTLCALYIMVQPQETGVSMNSRERMVANVVNVLRSKNQTVARLVEEQHAALQTTWVLQDRLASTEKYLKEVKKEDVAGLQLNSDIQQEIAAQERELVAVHQVVQELVERTSQNQPRLDFLVRTFIEQEDI